MEPDRVISLETLGQAHLIARRYPEAVRWLDSALTFQPEAAFFYTEVAYAHLLVGDTATARHSAALAAIHGNTNGREKIVAMIEAHRGDSAAAQRRMLVVDSASAKLDCALSHDCLELSFALASVGLRSRGLDVFERLRPRGEWLTYMSGRPEFDVIRSEPRFQRVLAESRANPR